MGLGVITGLIAIARVATAYQVKSDDLSWNGIPNAMTRIFEVNIGNITACIPVMKPFARYVHAIVTGRDPHEILHRKNSSNSRHEHWWYARGRDFLSRNKTKSQVSNRRQQQPTLPPGVMKMQALGVNSQVEQSDSQRSTSLGLPFQGVSGASHGDSTPDIPQMPERYGKRHVNGLGNEFDEIQDVKHIV